MGDVSLPQIYLGEGSDEITHICLQVLDEVPGIPAGGAKWRSWYERTDLFEQWVEICGKF